MKDEIIKSLFKPLGYELKGRILDSNKAIVQVFNFEIDLEYDYPDGFGEEFKNGEHVEFSVDRLDCIIENYY
ncbi:unknown [Firmicutes bacterium CAG:631]|nr:unknown [Firmicutes bacterium CAG:631]